VESDLVNDESDGLLAVSLFEFECHVMHALCKCEEGVAASVACSSNGTALRRTALTNPFVILPDDAVASHAQLDSILIGDARRYVTLFRAPEVFATIGAEPVVFLPFHHTRILPRGCCRDLRRSIHDQVTGYVAVAPDTPSSSERTWSREHHS